MPITPGGGFMDSFQSGMGLMSQLLQMKQSQERFKYQQERDQLADQRYNDEMNRIARENLDSDIRDSRAWMAGDTKLDPDAGLKPSNYDYWVGEMDRKYKEHGDNWPRDLRPEAFQRSGRLPFSGTVIPNMSMPDYRQRGYGTPEIEVQEQIRARQRQQTMKFLEDPQATTQMHGRIFTPGADSMTAMRNLGNERAAAIDAYGPDVAEAMTAGALQQIAAMADKEAEAERARIASMKDAGEQAKALSEFAFKQQEQLRLWFSSKKEASDEILSKVAEAVQNKRPIDMSVFQSDADKKFGRAWNEASRMIDEQGMTWTEAVRQVQAQFPDLLPTAEDNPDLNFESPTIAPEHRAVFQEIRKQGFTPLFDDKTRKIMAIGQDRKVYEWEEEGDAPAPTIAPPVAEQSPRKPAPADRKANATQSVSVLAPPQKPSSFLDLYQSGGYIPPDYWARLNQGRPLG